MLKTVIHAAQVRVTASPPPTHQEKFHIGDNYDQWVTTYPLSPFPRRKLWIITLCLFFFTSIVLWTYYKLSSTGYPVLCTVCAQLNAGGWTKCGSDGSPSDAPRSHRSAIIIPYRDRFNELQQFIPHLKRFLDAQHVAHTFYVVNQVDNFRFNRAALLNVGALESSRLESQGVAVDYVTQIEDSIPSESKRLCPPPTDYLVFHDVDLLPMDKALQYSWPSATGPYHLIPKWLHPRYKRLKTYFGGAVILRREIFNRLNGFSNSFWGWGLEDDEFRLRVLRSGLKISNPVGVVLGMNAFRIIHDEKKHFRDTATYYHPEIRNILSSGNGGLNTANYTLESKHLLIIDGVPALLLNVKLKCNMNAEICGA
ncbi:unnamed protein product [Dicrocoelium dendriticum]|nr:unnamed protein product [Dicrocoelium dendriticum]